MCSLDVKYNIVLVIMQARLKVRVVCSRAYHALFMRNMMIRPSDEELQDYGEPDFYIYNAGKCAVCSYHITCDLHVFLCQYAEPVHWRKLRSAMCHVHMRCFGDVGFQQTRMFQELTVTLP